MIHQDNLALKLNRLTATEESDQSGDELAFIFARNGIGQYSTKLVAHRLLPGEVLVFNRATGSKIAVHDHQSEFGFWSFSVNFENLLPLFDSKQISLLHAIVEGFKSPKIYAASRPLAVSCHRLVEMIPPQVNLDHRGQLIRIAATILSEEFNRIVSEMDSPARAENQVVRIFEKLSAAELIKLSVDELAARFNCSRRHLNRLFHQHFGVSVVALKMEMRLLKAISLLRDANVKITNVAEQCGFNHLGPFNTCFKRRFGTSPGHWRKSAFEMRGNFVRHTAPPFYSASGQRAAAPLPVIACIAGKISNGESILEDLKRRNLVFGVKTHGNQGNEHLTALHSEDKLLGRMEIAAQPTLNE